MKMKKNEKTSQRHICRTIIKLFKVNKKIHLFLFSRDIFFTLKIQKLKTKHGA